MLYTGIFDTHAHYDDERFNEDRDAVLGGLPEHGVSLVMNPACSLASTIACIAIAERYDYVYAAAGVHPEAAEEDGEGNWLERLAQACAHKKVKAVGEIGLDYHYDYPRELQLRVFEQQLGLAKDMGMPVIIHDREAHADMMDMLRKYRPQGIMHCYSGSAEMAKEILKLGLYIGFTGSVTFKNANKLLLAAKEVPDDRLLLETDCPYMAPVPFRGQRNDSSLIAATAERLAEIRGQDAQTLIDRCRENGRAVYKIDSEGVK